MELAGGPIGTLDAYARSERAWNESEVSALQACAGVVANLLGHAVAAYTQVRLARQLQVALEHRVVIEQGSELARPSRMVAEADSRLQHALTRTADCDFASSSVMWFSADFVIA